jgi:hypothetical protein
VEREAGKQRRVVKIESEDASRAQQQIAELKRRAAKEPKRQEEGEPARSDEPNAAQVKIRELIGRKKAKLANVELESERIDAKRDGEGGLSAGQEKTLAKNAATVEKLKGEIEAAEAKHEEAGGAKPAAAKKAAKKRAEEAEVDDVDFYDKTGASRSKLDEAIAGGSLGFAELREIRAGLLGEIAGKRKEAAALERRRGRFEPGEDDDELDAYEKSLKFAEAGEAVAKVGREEAELRGEVGKAEKLMDVIEAGWRERERREEEGREKERKEREMEKAEEEESRKRAAPPPAEEEVSMPPPPKKAREEVSMPPPPPPKPAKSPEMPPPPPKAVKGPAMPPPAAGPKKPPAGSIAAMMAAQASGSVKSVAAAPAGGLQAPAPKRKPAAPKEDEPQEDTWQAPKGQDGSGRTKLNEKFAGRY